MFGVIIALPLYPVVINNEAGGAGKGGMGLPMEKLRSIALRNEFYG